MSKFVDASVSAFTGGLYNPGLSEKKKKGAIDKPSPDELAADAEAAEKRKRRGMLGRAATKLTDRLGSANTGANLLSGK